MPDQDGAAAAVGTHGMADLAKHALQCIALRERRPERMVRVDARDREGGRIDARALEGLHVEGVRRAAPEHAIRAHVDERRGDLQQRIGAGLKAARLDVDRHRQVAAEAPRHERGRGCLRHGLRIGGLRGTHGRRFS